MSILYFLIHLVREINSVQLAWDMGEFVIGRELVTQYNICQEESKIYVSRRIGHFFEKDGGVFFHFESSIFLMIWF